MNTQSSNTFFYLFGGTDLEMHESACRCAISSALPHRAMGARLYKLDHAGLKALHYALLEEDGNSFYEWCNKHEPEAIYHGSDTQVAIAEGIHQACKDGKLLINYPQHFPWILPFINVLRGVVGYYCFDEEGYVPRDTCECNQTHIHTQMVCRVCYARYVCNIVYTYYISHIRRCESTGTDN